MDILQKEHKLPLPPADKVLFRKHVQRELDDIRQEAEQAYTLDNEIDLVPDAAFHDASSLLEILSYNDIPMPDIGWLMDGGIGFEWRSQDNKRIGTISIYGDNQVVYGASLGSKSRVKGTCFLSDSVLRVNFLPNVKGHGRISCMRDMYGKYRF